MSLSKRYVCYLCICLYLSAYLFEYIVDVLLLIIFQNPHATILTDAMLNDRTLIDDQPLYTPTTCKLHMFRTFSILLLKIID